MKSKNLCHSLVSYLLKSGFFVVLFFFIISCSRSPFSNTVEFKGKVYYGTESGDKILVLGPLPNARVVLVGTHFSATTDSEGRYHLKAEKPRSFTSNNYENYTLEASGTSSPIFPYGNYISQQITVQGKPGDTIQVRDFLLYKHKE